MGDVVNLPISLDSDLGRELTVDWPAFVKNYWTKRPYRKKYRFADDDWEKLGDDDEMIRAVEEESVRKIRDGARFAKKVRSWLWRPRTS